MVYPNKINIGEKIGVTALSSGLSDERGINKERYAKQNISNMGFKIVETKDVLQGKKLVSTDAKKRAEEFLSLWENEDIKHILIACGGEFLMETLPYIDKKTIESNKPKWVQGYSDVSLLLFFLTTNFDIATIHSYSFSTYAMTPLHESLLLPINFVQNVNDIAQSSYNLYEIQRNRDVGHEKDEMNLSEEVVYKSLYNKEKINMSGRLIGGCLDVLKVIIGTDFDNTQKFCKRQSEGMLWYIENCEMSVTDFKRALWQMKMAGWFDNANGFIIGRTNSKEAIEDFTYEDALHDIFDDMNVDVIYDIDVGHTNPQWMMVNGAFATFEYENEKGKILQKMI